MKHLILVPRAACGSRGFILCTVLLVGLGFPLAAGGSGEGCLINARLDSGDTRGLSVEALPLLGCLQVELGNLRGLVGDEVSRAGVWFRSGGETLCLQPDGSFLPASLPPGLQSMVDSSGRPKEGLLSVEVQKSPQSGLVIPPVMGKKSGLYLGEFSTGLLTLDRNSTLWRQSGNKIAFSLPLQPGGNITGQSEACCWLVLVPAGAQAAVALVSTCSLEFFPGEKALFADTTLFPATMSIAACALSLVWAVIADCYQTAGKNFDEAAWYSSFRNSMAGSVWYPAGSSSGAAIPGFPSLEMLKTVWDKRSPTGWPASLGKAVENFKTALLRNFINQGRTDWAGGIGGADGTGSHVFAPVYSARSNLYIQFLLRLWYTLGKPAQTRNMADWYEVIKTAELAAGPADLVLPDSFSFDWRNYRLVNPAEGQALARAAAKYLTWGVQAKSLRRALEIQAGITATRQVADAGLDSPDSAVSQGSTATSPGRTGDSRVSTLALMKVLDAWIGPEGPAPDALGESNYYPGAQTSLVPSAGAGASLLTLLSTQLSGFKVPENLGGAALPYAPFGVDSPRTWSYKLFKAMEYQTQRQQTGAGSTPANPPFLEYRQHEATQALSLCTGVDAPGFLGGCIALSGLANLVIGLSGQPKLVHLENYYRFKPDPVIASLQSAGKPASLPLPGGSNLTGTALTAALAAHNLAWQKESSRLRLSDFDLEQSTVLIPSLGQVRIGDLVYGEEGPDSSSRLGIVAAIQGNLADGMSLEEFFSRVLVIGIGESAPGSQIRIGLWGSPDKNLAFTDSPTGFSLRRLLVRKTEAPPVSSDRFPDEPWDFISSKPQGFTVNVRTLDESGSPAPGWRWIPNTGEYLGFRIEVGGLYRNKTHSIPEALALRFLPPEDRFWIGGTQDHNIENNQGSGFELVAVEGEKAIPLLAFIQQTGGTSLTQYRIAYTWSAAGTATNASTTTTSVSVISQAWDAGGNFKPGCALEVNSSGTLVFRNRQGSFSRFGLRPLDPLQTCPGDDLLLRFCRESEFDTRSGDLKNSANPELAASVPAPSWIAVYDKKLLWRANLYLDEGLSDDWNRLHPWNAPPGPVSASTSAMSATAATSTSSFGTAGPSSSTGTSAGSTFPAGNLPAGGIPWWVRRADGSFDDRWGYNEWNRKWDGNGETARGFAGLTSLNAGDGKQVITLPAFTPVRTLGGTIDAPDKDNFIGGTVAYSYPYHRHEPFQASQTTAGDAGSQDSPFDFVKKMLMQKQLLGDWYNEKGERFLVARSAWPDPAATNPEQMNSQNTWMANIRFLSPTEAADLPLWLGKNPGKAWYQYPLISNFSLKPWSSTRAPEDSWWHYEIDNPAGWDKTKVTKAFMPGLGLKVVTWFGLDDWHPSEQFDEILHVPESSRTTESYLDAAQVIEAGADCIGFAQRAMSWKINGQSSTPVKNKYLWKDLFDGIAEFNLTKGSDNVWTVMNAQTENKRRYPSKTEGGGQAEAATTIVHTRPNFETSAYMKSDSWTPSEKTSALNLLKKVVPGDIWVKDSGDTNVLWDNHIAIVASVPEDPESYVDPQKYMNDMILIEGEFTNKIQSVIKKLSVGDYNIGGVKGPKSIYKSYFILEDDMVDLNKKSWAILRLK